MSHMMFADRGIPGVVQVPASALYKRGAGGGFSGKIRLPADPIGTAVVTFDGVVAGLEIRVIDKDLNEVAGVESCAIDQVLSWPAYSPGSPYNDVQIRIVSFAYKIKDFPYTAVVGAQSIPVQLEADPWAVNP